MYQYRFQTMTLSGLAPSGRAVRTAVIALATLLAGCVSETVRIVDMTPPEQLQEVQAESELLDIGIAIFDPNVPEDYDEQIKLLIHRIFTDLRATVIAFF